MKVKLIEVLNMIEDKTLDDDERVIINDDLYYYNQDGRKFYTDPKSKYQNTYRNIYTDGLDLECDLIDRHIIEVNVLSESTEEIGELISITNEKAEKLTTKKDIVDKINELVREVNHLKRNE